MRVLRGLGADVDSYLPSRTEDGYGLSAATVARLAERGTRLLLTADCAITAVDEVAQARALGLDVVVTDHHSPRADGSLPEAPIVHPGGLRLPVPRPVRGRCRLQARGGAAGGRRARSGGGRRGPRPRRPGHRGRLRPAARREPPPRARGPACAGDLGQAGDPRAAARGQGRPGGARRARDRLSPGPADQRRRAPVPRRCGARAGAHRRSRPRRDDRRRARPRQRRAAPDRDADPLRGRGTGARARRAAGVRAGRRGLAPRGHRDRRLADRRAPSPPVRDARHGRRRGNRIGALDPGLRSAGRAGRERRAPAAPRRAPGGGGLHDRARGRSMPSAPRSSRTRRRSSRPRTSCPPSASTPWWRGTSSAWRWPRSSSGSRPSGSPTRRSRCSCRPRGWSMRGRWGRRAVTCASRWRPAATAPARSPSG